jgi:hypothetical protein
MLYNVQPGRYVWRFRRWLGDRCGQRVRVLARGKNGNLLVRFDDGYMCVSSWRCVRRRN